MATATKLGKPGMLVVGDVLREFNSHAILPVQLPDMLLHGTRWAPILTGDGYLRGFVRLEKPEEMRAQ